MIAEELMVGDFVNYQNNPIRVEEILKKGVIGNENAKVIPYSKLSPIPMTDDILKVLMCMSIEKMQGYTPEEKNKIYGIHSFMMDHYGQTRRQELLSESV